MIADVCQVARRDGATLNALVEHSRRLALVERLPTPEFRLRDASVGGHELDPCIGSLNDEQVCALGYGGRTGSVRVI